MDMASRWADGYGIQTRLEHFDSDTTTWVEGVYTWNRSIRATFKLPFRDGELGDAILGLLVKRYTNAGRSTSNWSITPSVQLPTGDEGDWDFSVLTSDEGDRVQSGPVFVYFKRNLMSRTEYRTRVGERDSAWSGGYYSLGIGIVY